MWFKWGGSRAAARLKKPTRRARAPAKTRTVCLSHREDADGISAAALIREAFGGTTVLVDYPGQMEALAEISADASLKRLFICDLGLSKKNQDAFVESLRALRKRRVQVTYIDHHDIPPAVRRRLGAAGVRMVHSTGECASVLVYQAFSRRLSEHARFVAACAAITDYMEDRPGGASLLRTYDRQFALVSATVLTYNIVSRQKDPDYLQGLVAALAASRYPHDIDGAYEQARLGAAKLAEVMSGVRRNLKRMKNLGYVETTDSGAGGAVNFALGLSGKDVGVAFRRRTSHGTCAVSVRGSRGCKVHLGRLVNSLATELGGSGGGHSKACGALVPEPKIRAFLRELNRRIG